MEQLITNPTVLFICTALLLSSAVALYKVYSKLIKRV
ncbi:Uncharacterised protein [Sphingobacterium spiritivorum]|uniref:Uncharacterized protein n=1 Tax=Sphingobacterium spiritivorum TaxID=258 RepID=A0A380BUD4_SPHSI|nr:Uncharacterised protein [Sphingobacterium spiritivorum]